MKTPASMPEFSFGYKYAKIFLHINRTGELGQTMTRFRFEPEVTGA
jgi:hypothetical protein